MLELSQLRFVTFLLVITINLREETRAGEDVGRESYLSSVLVSPEGRMRLRSFVLVCQTGAIVRGYR